MHSLRLSSIALCLALSTHLVGQTTGTQNTYAKKRNLQVEGVQVFNDEMARERAGDCKNANSTVSFNACFGEELKITTANFVHFEQVIRNIFVDGPAVGKPQRDLDQFNHVEQSWQQYKAVACQAAWQQFEGGAGAPSFELQCEIALTRSHMRELNLIYGNELHL